ncbi:S8 family peptidase [Bacillus paranthracis]
MLKILKKTEEIVEELKNINNSLDIDFIKEIGIISIKNSKLMPSVVQKINSKFINEIEVQGVLPKIKTETSNVTNGVNTANILEQYDKFKWHVKDVTNNFLTSGMEQGNKDVKIAVIDSGIDAEHPDLRSLIDSSNSKSYVKDDVSLKDEFGHGTQVAGIIKDIAPNITIEPYKVIGKEDGESYWTIQAIIDATKNHNDIINLSLGTYKVKNKKR